MGAAEVIAGIVVGVLSPVLLPVAVVYAVVTVTIETIREKIREWMKKKGKKATSAKVTKLFKDGNFNVVKTDIYKGKDKIGEIEIKAKRISDIKEGMRIAV